MKARVLLIALAAAGLMLSSCGSKTKAPKGETELVLPCSEFKSDRKTFRVYSFGESMDMNVAKKKAMSNAKTDLAGMISTTMKVVGDNYVKSMEVNNVEEVLERFEENARTVIDQELSGVLVVCDRPNEGGENRQVQVLHCHRARRRQDCKELLQSAL
jgi:hypothetical protein